MTNPQPLKEIMTIDDVCKFLNFKKSRVRYLVFTKNIPFYKIGASIRFNKCDVSNWLEKKKVDTT